MPLYNYVCPSCGYRVSEFNFIKDRNKERCPGCNSFMDMPVLSNAPRIGRTEPIVLEHIASKPMKFRNKKDLSRYCDTHQVRSNMCD